MDILAVSTWLRYLELCGETLSFPANGYRGDYVRPLAQQLKDSVGEQLRRDAAQVLAQLPADAPAGDKEAYIDALIERARDPDRRGWLPARAASCRSMPMLADIRNDLAEFGVRSTAGIRSAPSPTAARSIAPSTLLERRGGS